MFESASSRSRIVLILCLFALASILATPSALVFAQNGLTVTPITWDIIGLDSNNPPVGPRLFPVGARDATPCDVDALGDHRIAMVHEILALRVPNQPSPRDPSVHVSWPGFHEKLASLRA